MSKARIGGGIAIIVAGVVGFLVFLLSRLGGMSDAMHRLEAPGEIEMNLEPGTHTIYWEPSGLFQSLPDFEFSVTSKRSGTKAPLSSTWVTRRYSTMDGRRGVSEYSFEAGEAGPHVFAARYPAGKTGPKATLVVAPGGGFGILLTVLGCILILGGPIAAGVRLILSGVKRKPRPE